MAAFVKFNQFATDMAAGVHAGALNASTATLKIYLTNATPSASADSIKTDLAEITNENGYTAPIDVENSASTASGTITVVGVDKVITASGGTVGPFRYVVLYNDTPSSPLDPLIGYWDYGSAITLNSGETFTANFGASLFTVG